jgi:hypothetical protein
LKDIAKVEVEWHGQRRSNAFGIKRELVFGAVKEMAVFTNEEIGKKVPLGGTEAKNRETSENKGITEDGEWERGEVKEDG